MTPLLDTPSLSLSHDGGGQRDMKSTPGGGGEGGGGMEGLVEEARARETDRKLLQIPIIKANR